MIRKITGVVAALTITGLGVLALGSPVQADDHTVSYVDAGPVDLSGSWPCCSLQSQPSASTVAGSCVTGIWRSWFCGPGSGS